MSTGPCIAIEDGKVVEELRELCGPHDPVLARTVRPNTIRAIYGDTKVLELGGVHRDEHITCRNRTKPLVHSLVHKQKKKKKKKKKKQNHSVVPTGTKKKR